MNGEDKIPGIQEKRKGVAKWLKAYFNFCQTKLAVTQGVGTIGSHDIAPKYTSAMLSMSMQNKFQNDDEKSIMPVKKLEFTPKEKI